MKTLPIGYCTPRMLIEFLNELEPEHLDFPVVSCKDILYASRVKGEPENARYASFEIDITPYESDMAFRRLALKIAEFEKGG